MLPGAENPGADRVADDHRETKPTPSTRSRWPRDRLLDFQRSADVSEY